MIFGGGFEVGLKRSNGLDAHYFDKLYSCQDTAFPDFLLVIFHEILDQRLNVLVGLVLRNGTDHIADNSSNIG
jgi:hypothetical protein